MRRLIITICLFVLPSFLFAASFYAIRGTTVLTLPEPVSNNAVASVDLGGGKYYLVSFSGLGPGKTHNDIHSNTWVLRSGWDEWKRGPDVPGAEGRLASVAVTVSDRIYVFGGYTVADEGSEVSTPWVHSFDPVSMKFEKVSQMPVPVDDTVAVVYEDRYVYLISGWHDYGNVNLVQRFDTKTMSWSQATPTPGPGVFGHAGGIAGNRILYCDGVAIEPHENRSRDFAAVTNCYLGIISVDDGRRIDWRIVPPHPGSPRYRMAAIGFAGGLDGVMFVGGSENPYNYNGIGYNGEPSDPQKNVLLYLMDQGGWLALDTDYSGTMDHRGLVKYENGFVTIGGMGSNQRVISDVHTWSIDMRPVH